MQPIYRSPALVTAIATRGPTVDELSGFVQAMRAMSRPVPLSEPERDQLVDTCGTGSDGQGTFNISTAAALVAAAAGVKVAKHGNRGSPPSAAQPMCWKRSASRLSYRRRCGGVLTADRLHVSLCSGAAPGMKRVQPVRRALGFRTIFNLAGPLANPAGSESPGRGRL